MNYNIQPSTKIHTIDDAIQLSKSRLPKLVFDFIDGAIYPRYLNRVEHLTPDLRT